MARPPHYPFIIRKASIWHARLDIPADVRPAFSGKRLFSRSTKLSDADLAFAKAKPWIDQWKAQIEAARSGTQAFLATDIAKRLLAEPEGATRDFMLLDTVAGFVARTQFGLSELEWQNSLVAHDLDPRAALESLRGREAAHSIDVITQVRTPFANRTSDFQKANEGALVTKVLYGYVLDVENFARVSNNLSIENFGRTHVQAFINKRCSEADVKTVKRQLSAVRTYWTWLASTDTTLKQRKPFDEIEWPKTRRKKLDPTSPDFQIDDDEDGPRFTPNQVVALWEAANGPDLRDAIVIAAYTGARREGIFRLHLNTVFLDVAVPYLLLIEKTEAGKRRVPVHPDIMPILRRRVQHPQEDGYLFRATKNKIDSRSARLTNPMSDLLRSQGFEKRGFGFHSFRRTFVDFLQSASISELHAAKIVGHAIRTITYGLYAGRLPLETARNIMIQTVKYPKKPN